MYIIHTLAGNENQSAVGRVKYLSVIYFDGIFLNDHCKVVERFPQTSATRLKN